MKRLYLLRHAKSSWDEAALSDFERTLNERGRRDAPAMARWFARHQPPPQIVSSPACRALATAQIFADALHMSHSAIRREPRIYDASLHDLRHVVAGLDAGADSVLLVGHNPGMSHLAAYLTGDASLDMPTCGLYGFQLDISSWEEVTSGLAETICFMTPKQLPGDAG